jgi:hypothetical protein
MTQSATTQISTTDGAVRIQPTIIANKLLRIIRENR